MAFDYRQLGKQIQHYRQKRGISQFRFAELIHTSPAFVSRMERGLKGPRLETLILIADTLDVPVGTLLNDHATQKQISEGAALPLLSDCSTYERQVLIHTLRELKTALREYAPSSEEDSILY